MVRLVAFVFVSLALVCCALPEDSSTKSSNAAELCTDTEGLSERQLDALEQIRGFEEARRTRWNVPPWDIEAVDPKNDPCLKEIENIDTVAVLHRPPTWTQDWAAIYVPNSELRVTVCTVRARFRDDGREVRVFVAAPSVIVFADADATSNQWLPQGLRVLLRYVPQADERLTDNHIDYQDATMHEQFRWLPLYLKNKTPLDYFDIDLSYVKSDILEHFPNPHRPYVGAQASLVPISLVDSDLAPLLGHIVVGRLAWRGF